MDRQDHRQMLGPARPPTLEKPQENGTLLPPGPAPVAEMPLEPSYVIMMSSLAGFNKGAG